MTNTNFRKEQTCVQLRILTSTQSHFRTFQQTNAAEKVLTCWNMLVHHFVPDQDQLSPQIQNH